MEQVIPTSSGAVLAEAEGATAIVAMAATVSVVLGFELVLVVGTATFADTESAGAVAAPDDGGALHPIARPRAARMGKGAIGREGDMGDSVGETAR